MAQVPCNRARWAPAVYSRPAPAYTMEPGNRAAVTNTRAVQTIAGVTLAAVQMLAAQTIAGVIVAAMQIMAETALYWERSKMVMEQE